MVVVAFVAMAATPVLGGRLPATSRVGAALVACATIFVLTYLVLESRRREPRRDLSTLACYREVLERRHALLASVTKWYLAPFWPGIGLFLAGILAARWGEPGTLPTLAICTAVVVAVNASIALVNRRAARKLAAELAALPSSDE